jgi:hypothetical protein
MHQTLDKCTWSKLERVARELTGAARGTAVNHDFCFHMTDWVDELRALSKLVQSPADASDEEWKKAVQGFLIHASGHILAAARIAGYAPVEFELPEKPRRQGESRRTAGARALGRAARPPV